MCVCACNSKRLAPRNQERIKPTAGQEEWSRKLCGRPRQLPPPLNTRSRLVVGSTPTQPGCQDQPRREGTNRKRHASAASCIPCDGGGPPPRTTTSSRVLSLQLKKLQSVPHSQHYRVKGGERSGTQARTVCATCIHMLRPDTRAPRTHRWSCTANQPTFSLRSTPLLSI
jgi:hypothetical protein